MNSGIYAAHQIIVYVKRDFSVNCLQNNNTHAVDLMPSPTFSGKSRMQTFNNQVGVRECPQAKVTSMSDNE